jgi:hypothetical protein
MTERRRWAGNTGIADEDVELAMTFVESGPEPCNSLEVREIERDQRCAAAILADLVIEFFKAALGPCDRDHVRSGAG